MSMPANDYPQDAPARTPASSSGPGSAAAAEPEGGSAPTGPNWGLVMLATVLLCVSVLTGVYVVTRRTVDLGDVRPAGLIGVGVALLIVGQVGLLLRRRK